VLALSPPSLITSSLVWPTLLQQPQGLDGK
jgi:hypothetical protein